MNNINWKQLKQYQEVFGLSKMLYLWSEYLSFSDQYWHSLDNDKNKNLVYVFHNWRSSSRVFGMDDFAVLCQRIEEKIQKQQDYMDNIFQLRQIYDTNIKELNKYFINMEQSNE